MHSEVLLSHKAGTVGESETKGSFEDEQIHQQSGEHE
jgi:hypothetical protein